MSSENGRKPLVLAVIGLIVGYGVATAQHFFTNESMRRSVENAQGDIRQLQGGRDAIEKRANRLEAHVYIYQAIESIKSGNSRAARQFLSNAATFFENGALKNNPDHADVIQQINAIRSAPTTEGMIALRDKMARLTPAISAVSGGAGQ